MALWRDIWKLPTVGQGQFGKEMNHLRAGVQVHGV